MAEDESKRVKFCRYCDGVIEWGTKVCPHCGESLELVDFEELDFVKVDEAPAGPAAPASPPVVEPLAPAAAPVVEPIGPPRKPKAPSPPVLKPIAGKPTRPPVAKPTARVRRRKPGPPVVEPVSGGEPPVVAPLPEVADLPPEVSPLEECPICGSEVADPATVGGSCPECQATVCLACLMRANGVSAGPEGAENRAKWDRLLAQGNRTIRCPACGRPGIR